MPLHRRSFLASTVFTCAGTYQLLAGATKPVGPNDRITLGFIGVGIMGRGHLNGFLGQQDLQVLAVCDVVTERRQNALSMVETRYAKQKGTDTYKACAAFNDFRELLARKDIDAVVIATPDHWHTIPCVLAARAKKDIYCEKPLTRTIGEGRRIVNEVDKAKIIFQTGSQQRSEFGHRFRKAVVMIRYVKLIGDIKTIRIGVGAPAIPCDLPGQPIPEGTDWKLWVGPAAIREYNEILCPKGIHQHFPLWRNYREYAGGGLADMGAHHFDIAQWALDMDKSGPVSIEPPSDKKNTGLRYVYANGTQMFHGGPSGCTFEGTKGTIYVDRDKFETSVANVPKATLHDEEVIYYSTNHHRNWIECIRSRKQPICPAEVGHRSASICHLGNLGYQLGVPLKWDPQAERFIDNENANKLVNPPYRGEWQAMNT